MTRFTAPAMVSGIPVGPVHVIETGPDDDPSSVVIARINPGKTFEVWQFLISATFMRKVPEPYLKCSMRSEKAGDRVSLATSSV